MNFEPSQNEESYFANIEAERRKKIANEQQVQKAAEENERLKQLHFMCCPKCGQKLIEINYKEILIDQCTGCEGVFLDKGEIDQLLKMDENLISRFGKIFLGA